MLKKFSKKQTTSFQKRVYEVVKKIPQGKVMSYSQVAIKIGKPLAWRAVGSALNRNINPKVPCHRVVKSDGQIGGYREGTHLKISLLKKEGVVIRNRRVVL